MKYLDILKKFDQAIVAENKKLQDIYNSLVNESLSCDQCDGDDGCSCENNESEDDKKQMCEFASETDNSDDVDSGEGNDHATGKSTEKLITADEFFNGVDTTGNGTASDGTENTGDGTATADGDGSDVSAKKDDADTDDEEPVSEENVSKEVKEFFDEDDNGNGEEGTVKPDGKTEDDVDIQKESSPEQRMAISASELFETEGEEDGGSADGDSEGNASDKGEGNENKKEDTSSKNAATGNSENGTDAGSGTENSNSGDGNDGSDAGQEEKASAEQDKTTDSDGEKKDANESCNKKNKKTAADWLGEREEPVQGDDGQGADEDDDDDGQKALQESIKNISAFVQANKKLFVG